MRTIGLCLALLASTQLTLIASPARAEGNAPAPSAPPAEPAPSAPPAAPAAAPAAPEAGTVTVHINSSAPVTLQHRANATAAWESACTSPCDQRVPVGDEYQVAAGGDAPASKPFRLDSSRGTVTLDVSPGDSKKKSTGVVVTIVGGVLIVAGAITMIAGSKPSDTFPANGTTGNKNTNILFVGGALVFAGVVAGIYGGSMWINGGKTAVEGDVGATAASTGANTTQQKTAQQIQSTTTSLIVPILSGTF